MKILKKYLEKKQRETGMVADGAPISGGNLSLKLIAGGVVRDGVSTDKVEKAQRKIIKSFKSRYDAQKRWYDYFADFMTVQFGKIWFFVLNLLVFVFWIVWNAGLIPGLLPFDQYPFNFLTMMVSLEAIFLSIIVLISQNRQSNMADMREEIDFNINIRAEQEITKILTILDKIEKKIFPEDGEDEELIDMERATDVDAIEKQIAEDYGNIERTKQ